jgi:hypothetical protein
MQKAIYHYVSLKTKEARNSYFNACTNLMDDEIREKLHNEIHQFYKENALGFFTIEHEFLANYCLRHFEKFNKEFIVN